MKTLIALIYLAPILAFSGIISDKSRDYWEYHKLINKAEILVCDEDFQEALNIYDGVFENYDFIFLRDYKIAAQLAFHLNQKEKAFQIIRQGVSAGWDIKHIRKHDYLSKLKDEPEWESIEKAYPELRKEYLERIDRNTRERVFQMFKKDQRKALGALFRIGDKAQEKYALKKFAPHSEGQLKKLIAILNDQGYPGEQLIGNDFWMSTILSHHNSITSEYVHKDTLYNFIRPKLIQAIERGEISPYEFALIDDWRIAVASERTQTGYGFLNPPLSSSLFETNKLRSKIGLRSIELRNGLVDIEQKTGMNFYLPNSVDGKIQIEE